MFFRLNQYDKEFYKNNLESFLPQKIIDVHTHVWKKEHMIVNTQANQRTVSWPSMVADENPIEDLIETYKLMFPSKSVIPVIFSNIRAEGDFDLNNEYIQKCGAINNLPTLLYTPPWWSAEELEQRLIDGNFSGIKVYLDLSPKHIPTDEITIFDYLTHEHLEVIDKLCKVVMLHIPRPARLKDPLNLNQMLEIEQKYPNVKLIIAHVGRAYCPEDVGNAFEILKNTEKMFFDISANCSQYVFESLLNSVSTKRILFGSDLPILRMRTKRLCENGTYINLVPKGLYGDVSGDSHMREVEGSDADKLTFFMYEELEAFRLAADNIGLSRKDIDNIFYNNAAKLFNIR